MIQVRKRGAMNETNNDNELEELVLKESIVSATGLSEASVQIGIKGDPSLRETTLERKKYLSPVDTVFDQLRPNLEELLLGRGTYRLYIGLNSGEIRTASVFDPMREEIHAADKLAERAYIDRHFPTIPFEEKVAAMRRLYDWLAESGLYDRLPNHWRNIITKRHAAWQPMGPEEIRTVLGSLKALRDMPDYYLRNITLSLVQKTVKMQFNCDGTQIVSAENYRTFLEENIP